MLENHSSSQNQSHKILVCQNRTCYKQGSDRILAALEFAGSQTQVSVEVIGCGCLGHCGSGPMVLVLPEETWYSHVNLDQISAIVQPLFLF